MIAEMIHEPVKALGATGGVLYEIYRTERCFVLNGRYPGRSMWTIEAGMSVEYLVDYYNKEIRND